MTQENKFYAITLCSALKTSYLQFEVYIHTLNASPNRYDVSLPCVPSKDDLLCCCSSEGSFRLVGCSQCCQCLLCPLGALPPPLQKHRLPKTVQPAVSSRHDRGISAQYQCSAKHSHADRRTQSLLVLHQQQSAQQQKSQLFDRLRVGE